MATPGHKPRLRRTQTPFFEKRKHNQSPDSKLDQSKSRLPSPTPWVLPNIQHGNEYNNPTEEVIAADLPDTGITLTLVNPPLTLPPKKVGVLTEATKNKSEKQKTKKRKEPELEDNTHALADFWGKPSGWKCQTCYASNQNHDLTCPCCSSVQPGADPAAVEAYKKKKEQEQDEKSSDVPATNTDGIKGSIGKKGFTLAASSSSGATGTGAFVFKSQFGTSAAKSAGVTFKTGTPASKSTAGQSATPGFKFGAASAAVTPGFKFGGALPAKETPGFKFGGGAATAAPATPAGFKFEETTATAPTPAAAAPTPGFKFEGTSAPTAAPTPGFKVGGAPTPVPAATPGFKVGDTSKAPKATPGFQFGGKPKATPGFQFGGTSTTTPGFKTEGGAAPATGVSFGGTSEKNETPAQKNPLKATLQNEKKAETPMASTGFSFGVKAPMTEPPSKTQFNKSDEPVAPKTEAKEGNFQFGLSASQPSSFLKTGQQSSATTPSNPAFSFRSSTSVPQQLPTNDGGGENQKKKKRGAGDGEITFPMKLSTPTAAAPNPGNMGKTNKAANPAFSFGQSTIQSTSGVASEKKPAFSFNAGSSSDTSAGGNSTFGSSFGSTPAPASGTPNPFGNPSATSLGGGSSSGGFVFGDASSGPGAKPTESAVVPFSTFPSATAAPAAPLNVDAKPFSFGATMPANPPAPAGSFGFGSNSAPSQQFGAATPSAPSFGQHAPAAPSSGFGTPSARFGASSQFGTSTPAPTPAFGFGAGSAPTPASTFGNAPGFGAPAPATPGFGGGNTFGNQPQAAPPSGFGAPTPSNAFGAQPAAPQPGGFSIGSSSTSKTPGRRRIVKARRPPSRK